MHEEYAKREQESKAYRAFVAGKKGETVAFIPTTSWVNPDSNYFTGYSNQGGAIRTGNSRIQNAWKSR